MNIAHIEEHSFIYGPGCRFVIWVQGCSIRCKGCWNTEMWAFENRMLISVEELIQKIENEQDTIEGITILGGEPLDQYDEVLDLIMRCKTLNISTMVFTGYEMAELSDKKELLGNLDILITGRYDLTKRTLNQQWIGSTNQEIHFLSDKYSDYEIKNNNYIEISLDNFGKIDLYGFPENNFLR